MEDEILELTKNLVSIPSVNTTEGEREIALFLERYIREIPYFKEHPEYVIVTPLKNDSYQRRNVMALLKGEKEENHRTIIWHGHTDTVGVEDYGFLKEFAFDCDKLEEKLKEILLSQEVSEDLESGAYLFGRGACDMKSGDAVFLVLLKHLSENPKDFSGNILVSLNPVEENLHTGIIEGLDVIEELGVKENLEYVLAINNDYICPLYPGDDTRYIYAGAVGKLLPCFYIMGKETHVGQCFEGLDATMVSAELVRILNLNTDYCDGYKGEYTLPPSVLKMKDLKDFYNVQTAFSAFVYFNYFVHNKNMVEITELLIGAANQAFDNTITLMNQRYKNYCELENMSYKEITYDTQVLTYDQLYKKAENNYSGELKSVITNMVRKELVNQLDKREIPLQITKKLIEIAGINTPTIVLFFAAPYCPHNTLKNDVIKEKELLKKIEHLSNKYGREIGENFEIKQFFPSLSDSSYLKIDDDEESIQCLVNNFPAYEEIYPLPIEQIKRMDIPAINYGCFGKDAHKWTERVYKPYSFEILPQLILKTVDEILN